MTEAHTTREVDRLHEELARIYRLGRLTPQEELKVKGLWARIERLETAYAAAVAREQKMMDRQRTFTEGKNNGSN